MVRYRGAEAQDVADSIEAAQAFVRSLECDDIITRQINRITPEDIQEIRTAETKEDVVKAMEAPYTIILYMADFFKGHGMLDTDNTGLEVARGLEAWGALAVAAALADQGYTVVSAASGDPVEARSDLAQDSGAPDLSL